LALNLIDFMDTDRHRKPLSSALTQKHVREDMAQEPLNKLQYGPWRIEISRYVVYSNIPTKEEPTRVRLTVSRTRNDRPRHRDHVAASHDQGLLTDVKNVLSPDDHRNTNQGGWSHWREPAFGDDRLCKLYFNILDYTRSSTSVSSSTPISDGETRRLITERSRMVRETVKEKVEKGKNSLPLPLAIK